MGKKRRGSHGNRKEIPVVGAQRRKGARKAAKAARMGLQSQAVPAVRPRQVSDALVWGGQALRAARQQWNIDIILPFNTSSPELAQITWV